MTAPAAPTLFLSDLHLSPSRPAAVEALEAFARGPAREARAVYILGDLFDWWIGDDQVADPFVARIVKALRGIADGGVALHVGRGNRDFLLGERFAAAVGGRLLPEQLVVGDGIAPTLVLHGDELCTDDVQYQHYRAWARDPQRQRKFLGLPYIARRAIASWLRRKSRNATRLKPESIMDVNPDAVARAFREHGVSRMIHGHTHRPARHEHDVDRTVSERYVLADWHDHGHWLEVDASGVRVREIGGQRSGAGSR